MHIHVHPAGATTLADSSGNGYNNYVIVNGGTTNGQYLSLVAAQKQSVTLDSSAIPSVVSTSYTISGCLKPLTTPSWSRFFDFNSQIVTSGSDPCLFTPKVTIWQTTVNYGNANNNKVGYEIYNNCGATASIYGESTTGIGNVFWTQVTLKSDGNVVSTVYTGGISEAPLRTYMHALSVSSPRTPPTFPRPLSFFPT